MPDCVSYQDFIGKGLLLTMSLLHQGFLLVKLQSFMVGIMTWYEMAFVIPINMKRNGIDCGTNKCGIFVVIYDSSVL